MTRANLFFSLLAALAAYLIAATFLNPGAGLLAAGLAAGINGMLNEIQPEFD
jgi:hypothetical protein